MQSQHHSQSSESRSGEDCGGEQQALALSVWEINSQICRKSMQMTGCKIEGGTCGSAPDLEKSMECRKCRKMVSCKIEGRVLQNDP